MELLVHRTKILLGAVYSLIDMHAIDETAPAFEEYCDRLVLALEYFTDETFTRAELINYSFEHVLAETKAENTVSEDDLRVLDELQRLWQEKQERETRDELCGNWLGDNIDG